MNKLKSKITTSEISHHAFIFEAMKAQPTLFTCLSPALLHHYNVENAIVVIIDVFRATSTIAAALHHGASCVIPVADVDECKRIGAATYNAITAGEREGKVIEGLQYGNSPAEYPEDFIKGKTLVLTTTNGTKLLHMAVAKGCAKIITGTFPNLSAVCEHIVQENRNIILACSGWKERFNLEDTLFAGAVINNVKMHFTIHCDSSLMAEEMYRLHQNDLFSFIQQTTHWQRLAAYGLEKDLEYCVSIDVANVLPVYKHGRLVSG